MEVFAFGQRRRLGNRNGNILADQGPGINLGVKALKHHQQLTGTDGLGRFYAVAAQTDAQHLADIETMGYVAQDPYANAA